MPALEPGHGIALIVAGILVTPLIAAHVRDWRRERRGRR
jgi:hypothetical protein